MPESATPSPDRDPSITPDGRAPLGGLSRLLVPAVLGLSVVPVLLAATQSRGVMPVPLAIAAVARPGLSFDQYAVNIGPVQPLAQAEAIFSFVNQGREPVHVVEIAPSCSCLQAQAESMEIAPGERTSLRARVSTASQTPGRKEYTIELRYNDPRPQVAVLTFRFEVPEKTVIVRPRAIVFYQFGAEPTSQTVEVIDSRIVESPRDRLEIVDLKCASDLVQVEPLEPQLSPEGQWVCPLKVTVKGQVPPGMHSAMVQIRTLDERYPELRLPIRIFGPTAGVPGDAEAEAQHGPTAPAPAAESGRDAR